MTLDHLINLLNVPKIGQQRIRLLVSHLGMDINPFELAIKELCTVNGIDKKSAEQIRKYSDFNFGIRKWTEPPKKESLLFHSGMIIIPCC